LERVVGSPHHGTVRLLRLTSFERALCEQIPGQQLLEAARNSHRNGEGWRELYQPCKKRREKTQDLRS